MQIVKISQLVVLYHCLLCLLYPKKIASSDNDDNLRFYNVNNKHFHEFNMFTISDPSSNLVMKYFWPDSVYSCVNWMKSEKLKFASLKEYICVELILNVDRIKMRSNNWRTKITAGHPACVSFHVGPYTKYNLNLFLKIFGLLIV